MIEDTTVDYDEVLHHFGKEIADIVATLSKDMRMIESAREPAYDAQLAAGPWEARLIKLADVFDNITDADTEKAQLMLVGKAHRALKLAEGEAKLANACEIVEELIGKVKANGIK